LRPEPPVLIAVLTALWCGYFLIHSLLASLTVKRWYAGRWPRLRPFYRLFFNGVALLLLIPPVWLTFAWHGPWLWQWRGITAWIATGLALTACALFLWTFRYYDGAEFLGLRQWRRGERSVEDRETLHISPLHRHVRHPWYALGLVLVWTRDMDLALLTSSVLVSLYFILGSRFEERKLIVFHGDAYRKYRKRVPPLFPLPWSRLSSQEARELEQAARRERAE
jgi:protein-S-isoprenylcysteine O-methyltransferase Ste14